MRPCVFVDRIYSPSRQRNLFALATKKKDRLAGGPWSVPIEAMCPDYTVRI
jgi:hypothetical protein